MITVFGHRLIADPQAVVAATTPFGAVVIDVVADRLVDRDHDVTGRLRSGAVARSITTPTAIVEMAAWSFVPAQAADHPALRGRILLARLGARTTLTRPTVTVGLTRPRPDVSSGLGSGERLHAWEASDGRSALSIGGPDDEALRHQAAAGLLPRQWQRWYEGSWRHRAEAGIAEDDVRGRGLRWAFPELPAGQAFTLAAAVCWMPTEEVDDEVVPWRACDMPTEEALALLADGTAASAGCTD